MATTKKQSPLPPLSSGLDWTQTGDFVPAQAPAPDAAPNTDGQFTSGFKRSFQELPGLAAGVGGYMADVVGADGLRDKALAYAKQREDDLGQQHANDASSFSDVMDGKASATDFIANAAGYVTGQALQAFATGGVGSLGMRALVKTGAADIGKMAAERAIAQGASEDAARKVASDAMAARMAQATKVGAAAGAGTHNLGMELGSIFPDAVDEAQSQGRTLGGGDLARVGMSSLAAAGIDTASEGVMASRVFGGSASHGATFMRRLAREVPEGMLREGGTEAAQTAIEHYGAGQPIADAKGMRDIIDSAAIGSVGGGLGAPLAATHARQLTGDDLRQNLLPETGPLTKALNSATEAAAQKVDASNARPDLAPLDFTLPQAPPPADITTSLGAAPAPAAAAGNGIDFQPTTVPGTAPSFPTAQDASIAIGQQGLMGSHQPVQVGPDQWQIQPVGAPGATMVAPGVYDLPPSQPAIPPAATPRPDPVSSAVAPPVLAPFQAAAAPAAPVMPPAAPVEPAGISVEEAHSMAGAVHAAGGPETVVGANGHPRAAFSDEATARQFLRDAKRGGSTVASGFQPVALPDGRWMLGNAEDAEKFRAYDDVGAPSGGPLKTKLAANAKAKKLGGEIVPVDGGFVVRVQRAPVDAASAAPVAPSVQPTPALVAPESATPTSTQGARDGQGQEQVQGQRQEGLLNPGAASESEAPAASPIPAPEAATAPQAVDLSAPMPQYPKQISEQMQALGAVAEARQQAAVTRGEPEGHVFDHFTTPELERLSALAHAMPGTSAASQQSRAEVAQALADRKDAEAPAAAQASEWATFPPEAGSLGVPRAEMPQVQSEHHGPLVNFLNARGISHTTEEVDPNTLRPTQAEYSNSKADALLDQPPGQRSVLVSSDGYVLDGHHQTIAAMHKDEPLKVIRFDAPIHTLLDAAKQFPSATTADEGSTHVEDATQAEGQGSPTGEPSSKAQAGDATAASGAVSVGDGPTAGSDAQAGLVGQTDPIPFKRSETADALPQRVNEVHALAQHIASRWANAPEIITVGDMQDPAVPEAVRKHDAKQRSQGAQGDPEGFYHGGKVYLVASQLPGAIHVVRVLMHEGLGHHGLRAVYGKHLGTLLDRLAILNSGKVRDKARQYGLDYNKQSDRRVAAEEVLAEMAQSSPELGWVKRTVAAVRSWLRENVPGMRGMKLTDEEVIRDYIIPAREWVKRGDTTTIGRPETHDSKSGSPSAFSRSLGAALMDRTATVRSMSLPAGYVVNDFFDRHGKVSLWDKSVGTMYNLAQKSPRFKRVFDGVQHFISDVSFYANEAMNEAPTIIPKLEDLKDIARTPLSPEDTKALSRPVFEGTLMWTRDVDGKPIRAEGDQKGGIVWTPAELRGRFGLNDKQVGLYREFRAATDRSLTDLAKSHMVRLGGDDTKVVADMALEAKSVEAAAKILADALDKQSKVQPARATLLTDNAGRMHEIAAQAQSLIDAGYAPLSRFGHYTLDVVDKTGDRVYFGLFESPSERARMQRKLVEQYPEAKVLAGTTSEREYELFNGVSPETLQLFGEFLGLESQGDSETEKVFQEYIKRGVASRSAMKRLIERKGVAGFSEDAGRVLAAFLYSNARQTSANLHLGNVSRAVSEVDQNSDGTRTGQGELKDVAVDLVKYVQNPTQEAQRLRGLLFANFLGGNLASALWNATQPATTTLPYLSQHGGAALAAKHLIAAGTLLTKRAGLAPDLQAALKRASEEGVVAPAEIHMLQGQAAGRGALQSGDGTKMGNASARVNNGMAKFGLAWGKLFGLAETWNRRLTFVAAYNLAKERGISDPAGFATKAVQETQFVANKGNKPKWARGAVGSVAFTFKQYGVSYLELLHRMWTQGGPEGKRATMLALGMLFMMGGADGMPFMDDVGDLVDGLLQRLGYDVSSKQKRHEFFEKTFGRELGDFMSKGVSGLPGVPIDVSGRASMSNLLPGTGFLTLKKDHAQDWAELGGPGASYAMQIAGAANQVSRGDVLGGVTAALPTAGSSLVKAWDMATTGAYHDQRGAKVIDTDAADAVVKAAGFQPNDVARVQAAKGEETRYRDQFSMRKQEISQKWAEGLIQGKPDMVTQARADLLDWNQKNPEARMAVNMSSILHTVREAKKTAPQRLADTAPKALRAKIRGDMAQVQGE